MIEVWFGRLKWGRSPLGKHRVIGPLEVTEQFHGMVLLGPYLIKHDPAAEVFRCEQRTTDLTPAASGGAHPPIMATFGRLTDLCYRGEGLGKN